MSKKSIIFIALITLFLSACGVKDKIEEAATEQIAETILEQTTGIEDVEINTEDGSFSYTIEDEDGNETSMELNTSEDIDAIVGMGFNIPLPDEFVDGSIQEVKEGDELTMLAAQFSTGELTNAEIYDALHQSLTAAGFVYNDLMGTGATEPDPSVVPSAAYQHADGFVFTISGGEERIVLGLIRDESIAESIGAETAVSDDTTDIAGTTTELPTTLDGSMALDKESYAVNEAIEVSLIINTPIADNGWVGIVPSDTPHGDESENDRYDVAYQYVRNLDNGIIILNAPSVAGDYDVRLFNTDSNGVELASISIQVTE